MRLLLLLFAGCWTTGPSALVRRQQAAGDVVRVCSRGDATVTSPELAQPIIVTTRNIYDEHVLAAKPHSFDVRSDTVSASARMVVPGHEPVAIDVPKREGDVVEVDDRNRRVGAAPESSKVVDSDRVNLSFVPYVADLAEIAYPESALRKRVTFPIHVHRSIEHADALPSDLAIDATFTVREVTAQFVELDCKGTHVESTQYGDQRAAVALDFTCRVRIGRRDGRTARWWIDATGTTTTSPEAKWAMHIQSHYDIAIGDVDAGVCERAREAS
jgi:hypothetical protein